MAPVAAILISRQPLRPSGQTDWVKQAVRAVEWVRCQGMTLCSSVGMQTWELLTALASDNSIPLRLYLPDNSVLKFTREDCARQFALRQDSVECIAVDRLPGQSKEECLAERDRRIIREAELLIPLSIRPDGHLANLLEDARVRGKVIVSDYMIPWKKNVEASESRVEGMTVNPAARALGSTYLIHWTRAPHGQWPDEPAITYYRDLIRSTSFPRSGLDTLKRIVRTERILASSRHMPGEIATVAFSALTPIEVVPLMKWRARYAEMSFEPYGIGIEKTLAEKMGILPVQYYDKMKPTVYSTMPWLCQSQGKRTDWRQEAEYRHLGDARLQIPREKMMLFCKTEVEAQDLSRLFGVSTTHLFQR